MGKAAGRERVRRRAHRVSATTFDSKNGGHGAKSAFAHPRDCSSHDEMVDPDRKPSQANAGRVPDGIRDRAGDAYVLVSDDRF